MSNQTTTTLYREVFDKITDPSGEDKLFEYLPQTYKRYVREFALPPIQLGLSLLGYCLGEVARAQYNSGLKNRPILSKLDYQGMNREKVIRLFNTVFEKFHQYKEIGSFPREWLAIAQSLYSSSKDELSIHERLYYILLGYSFFQLRFFSQDNSDK